MRLGYCSRYSGHHLVKFSDDTALVTPEVKHDPVLNLWTGVGHFHLNKSKTKELIFDFRLYLGS